MATPIWSILKNRSKRGEFGPKCLGFVRGTHMVVVLQIQINKMYQKSVPSRKGAEAEDVDRFWWPIDQASEANLEGYPPRLLRPQGCFFVTPDRRSLVALIVGTITAHATHPDATESPWRGQQGQIQSPEAVRHIFSTYCAGQNGTRVGHDRPRVCGCGVDQLCKW